MGRFFATLLSFFSSLFTGTHAAGNISKRAYTKDEVIRMLGGEREKQVKRQRTKRMYKVNGKLVRFSRRFDEERRLRRLHKFQKAA